jgi:hypothetical protein
MDILVLPHSETTLEVRSKARGNAMIVTARDRYSYRPTTGDPLGIGAHESLTETAAYEITAESDYPDSIVQLALLASAPRSGELIMSAARDWDFRAQYEPIPHVSSHGALHRDHMMVPLLVNRPVVRVPRRTVDVMPSALAALGVAIPGGLDGVSFMESATNGNRGDLASNRANDERDTESAVA